MEQIELEVASRDVLGKKVKVLRRQGITPVHVFGHGIESMALQCATPELRRVLAEAGQSRLINLKLNGEKTPRTVMVREIQREPRTGKSVHVDFYQVQMAEKLKVEVPIVFVGESPALKLKENMLVHDLNKLEVECLPGNIPASVELDISSLTDADQEIRVEDINLGEGVTILTDPEQIVVKIVLRHIEKEEEVRGAAGEAVVRAEEATPPTEEESKD
ncbi:MAG: 50S ribosomal protein L25 [Dehalococcoidales bacterium]|nr:50S ribosomal protein L25 [Dehalococcoidales bacterium]